jgi:hypothetical protein
MQGGAGISSSSTNPALQIVAAKERTARQWAAEQDGLGRKGFEGRTLLAAKDWKEAFRLREEAGMADEEVERAMRLKSGVLSGAPAGAVGNVQA